MLRPTLLRIPYFIFPPTSLHTRKFSLLSQLWQVVVKPDHAPPPLPDLQSYKSTITETSPYDYILVDTPEKLASASKYLKNETILCVDCEGTSLSRYGKLCVLQIATEKETFLFDVLSLGASTFQQGVASVLQDSTIMKVMHDCRADSDALFHLYNVKLANVYDLQMVHALHCRLRKGWNMPRASLYSIVTEHAPQETRALVYPYKDAIKPLYTSTPKLWEQRPLSQALINYACADVRMLFPVYHSITQKVEMARYSQYLHKKFVKQLAEFRDSKRPPYQYPSSK